MSKRSHITAVPRRSLVTEAIEILRSKVSDGTWRLGERLPPEPELAEALGVGRNTVREAIRVLSHSKMLDVRQGDGTYVQSLVDPAETLQRINRSSVRDHLEMQSILEAEAARFAARRRTNADIVTLNKLLDERGERTKYSNLEEFFERDRAFHQAVAAAAHNSAIEELYRYFALAIPMQSQVIRQEGELPEANVGAHRAIVEAITKKNEEAAVTAARKIFAARIKRLNEAISTKS